MWRYGGTEGGLRVFMTFISGLVTLFMIFMVVFTAISIKSRDKYGSTIAGYRFFIVLSDSMSETDKNKDLEIHFNAGDIVITKELNDEEKRGLKEGDVISFISSNSDSYDKVVTHMIREVKYDSNGNVMGYVTFGTATNTNDEALVRTDNVLGKYSTSIPKLGELFNFVRTPAGYLGFIFMPFVVLICWYGMKIMRILKEM